MAAPRRHQVLNASSVNASGNSGTLPNIGQTGSPNVVVLIDIKTAPTGTTPSIQFTLYSVLPSGDKVQIAQGAALTAIGTQRITASGVIDPNLELDWVLTGTTPVFPSVSADLFFSSPDY